MLSFQPETMMRNPVVADDVFVIVRPAWGRTGGKAWRSHVLIYKRHTRNDIELYGSALPRLLRVEQDNGQMRLSKKY